MRDFIDKTRALVAFGLFRLIAPRWVSDTVADALDAYGITAFPRQSRATEMEK